MGLRNQAALLQHSSHRVAFSERNSLLRVFHSASTGSLDEPTASDYDRALLDYSADPPPVNGPQPENLLVVDDGPFESRPDGRRQDFYASFKPLPLGNSLDR